MLFLIRLIHLGNFRHKGILWVGLFQKLIDVVQDVFNVKSWIPFFLDHRKTDRAIRVDVAVGDSSGETDFWWLEGVVRGEINV